MAICSSRTGKTESKIIDWPEETDSQFKQLHKPIHKLKSHGISGQNFDLISSFLSNRHLRMVLGGKSSQEYPDNAGVPHGSILRPALFLQYTNDILDDVICNIVIYAVAITKMDFWTLVWSMRYCRVGWLVDFNDGKTQLVLFDWSNNPDAVDLKMDESVLEEKSSFKMLGFTFSSKLDWDFYIVSIAKTASKKVVTLICSLQFLSPEIALYLYKSTMQPCMEYWIHVWAAYCYLELLDKL